MDSTGTGSTGGSDPGGTGPTGRRPTRERDPGRGRLPAPLVVPLVAGLATLVVMVVLALRSGGGDGAGPAVLFILWNVLPWAALALLVVVVHRREPLTAPVLWFGGVLLAVLAAALVTAALVSGDAQAGIVFAVLPVYLLLGLVLLLALSLVVGVGRRRSRTR